MKYKFVRDDPGNFRVYYRSEAGGLYCIQNEGAWGKDNFTFCFCSKDGEPDHAKAMPPPEFFDTFKLPDSLKRA